jgi:hypothetical protein
VLRETSALYTTLRADGAGSDACVAAVGRWRAAVSLGVAAPQAALDGARTAAAYVWFLVLLFAVAVPATLTLFCVHTGRKAVNLTTPEGASERPGGRHLCAPLQWVWTAAFLSSLVCVGVVAHALGSALGGASFAVSGVENVARTLSLRACVCAPPRPPPRFSPSPWRSERDSSPRPGTPLPPNLHRALCARCREREPTLDALHEELLCVARGECAARRRVRHGRPRVALWDVGRSAHAGRRAGLVPAGYFDNGGPPYQRPSFAAPAHVFIVAERSSRARRADPVHGHLGVDVGARLVFARASRARAAVRELRRARDDSHSRLFRFLRPRPPHGRRLVAQRWEALVEAVVGAATAAGCKGATRVVG